MPTPWSIPALAGDLQAKPSCPGRSGVEPLACDHPGWQPGQAEMAAAGGAGRRSAKTADRPLNQSREAHPFGLSAPLPPRGAMNSTPAQRRRLLEVVANYTRLSAVRAAGCAVRGERRGRNILECTHGLRAMSVRRRNPVGLRRPLSAGAESSPTARGLSGDGWWTDSETDTSRPAALTTVTMALVDTDGGASTPRGAHGDSHRAGDPLMVGLG
jgi:hypothetical protein